MPLFLALLRSYNVFRVHYLPSFYILFLCFLPLGYSINVSVVNVTGTLVPSVYTPTVWESCRPYVQLTENVWSSSMNNDSSSASFIPLPYETNTQYIQSTRYSIVTSQAYKSALIGSRNETVYYKCHTINCYRNPPHNNPVVQQVQGTIVIKIDNYEPAGYSKYSSSSSFIPYNVSIGIRIKLHPLALPLAEFELYRIIPLVTLNPSSVVGSSYTLDYSLPLMDSITHYFSYPGGPLNTSGYLSSTASWIYNTTLMDYSNGTIDPGFEITVVPFLFHSYGRSNATDALPTGLTEGINWNISSSESVTDTLFIDGSSYDEQNNILLSNNKHTNYKGKSIRIQPFYDSYNSTALLSCCPGLAFQYNSYPVTVNNTMACCWYHPEPSHGPSVGKLRVAASSVAITASGQMNTSVTLEWNIQTIKYNTSGKDILDFEIIWFDNLVRNYAGNRSLVLDVHSDMQGTIVHGNPLSMTSPTVLTQPWYYLIEPIPNDIHVKRWMRYNTTFYGVPVGIPQTYGVRVRYIEGNVGSWLWIKHTVTRKSNQPPRWNTDAYPTNFVKQYYDPDDVPPLLDGFYKYLPYLINVTELGTEYLPYYPNFTLSFRNISKYITDDYTSTSSLYMTIDPVYEETYPSNRSVSATRYPTLYRNFGYTNETFLFGSFTGNLSGVANDVYFTYIPLSNATLFMKEEEIIHRVKFTVWDTGVPKSLWLGNVTSGTDPLRLRNYDTRIAEPPKPWSFYIYFRYTDTFRNLPCPLHYFRNGTVCQPCLICSTGTYLSASCTDILWNSSPSFTAPTCLPCPDYSVQYPLYTYYPLTKLQVPVTCPIPWYLTENRTTHCTICNPMNETEITPCEPYRDTVCGPKGSTTSIVRYDQCKMDTLNDTVDKYSSMIASVCGAPGYKDTRCTVVAEGYWQSSDYSHPLPCRCGTGTTRVRKLALPNATSSMVITPSCDNRTGECHCQTNYHPPYCDNCIPGYYGDDCNRSCTCNAATSQCNDGLYGDGRCLCYDGWIGKNCSISVSNHLYVGLPSYVSENPGGNNGTSNGTSSSMVPILWSSMMDPLILYEGVPFIYDIPMNFFYIVVNGTVRNITCNDTLNNNSGINIIVNEAPDWIRFTQTPSNCRLHGTPQRHLLYNRYMYTVKYSENGGLDMVVLQVTYRKGIVDEILTLPLLFSIELKEESPIFNVSSSQLQNPLQSPMVYVPGEIFTLDLREAWGYVPLSTFPIPLREGNIIDKDMGYTVDTNITLVIEPRIDWLTINFDYEMIMTMDYVDTTIAVNNVSTYMLRGMYTIEGIIPWLFSHSAANRSQIITLKLYDTNGLGSILNISIVIATTGEPDYLPFQANISNSNVALSSMDVRVDDWFVYSLSITPPFMDNNKNNDVLSLRSRLIHACPPIDVRISVGEDISQSIVVTNNYQNISSTWLHLALSNPDPFMSTNLSSSVPFDLLVYGIPTTVDFHRSIYWNITLMIIGTCGYELIHSISLFLLPPLSPPVPTVTMLPSIEIVPEETSTVHFNYSAWNFTISNLDTLFSYPNYYPSESSFSSSSLSGSVHPSIVKYFLTGPQNRSLPRNILFNCSKFQCTVIVKPVLSVIPYPDLFGYYVFELRAYRYMDDNQLSLPIFIPVHINGCPRNEYLFYSSSNRNRLNYSVYVQSMNYVSNPYQVCGGRGICRSDINLCECFTGYSGVSCNRCSPMHIPIRIDNYRNSTNETVDRSLDGSSIGSNFTCVPVPLTDIDTAIQKAGIQVLLSNRIDTLIPLDEYPIARSYLDALAVQMATVNGESASSSNWTFEEGSPLFIIVLCFIGSLLSGLCAFGWSICLGKRSSSQRNVQSSSSFIPTQPKLPTSSLTLRTPSMDSTKTEPRITVPSTRSKPLIEDHSTLPSVTNPPVSENSVPSSVITTNNEPLRSPPPPPPLGRLSRLRTISRAERGSRGTRFSELIEEDDIFVISPSNTVLENTPAVDIQEITISDRSSTSSVHSPNLRQRRKPLSSRSTTLSRISVSETIEHEPADTGTNQDTKIEN